MKIVNLQKADEQKRQNHLYEIHSYRTSTSIPLVDLEREIRANLINKCSPNDILSCKNQGRYYFESSLSQILAGRLSVMDAKICIINQDSRVLIEGQILVPPYLGTCLK